MSVDDWDAAPVAGSPCVPGVTAAVPSVQTRSANTVRRSAAPVTRDV
ncbi:hypothetical protein U3A55_06900 [Salarchaeum sp. III]